MSQLRNPRAWAERRVAQMRAEQATNYLANGACALQKIDTPDGFHPKTMPPSWWSWQHEKKRPGVFGTETGVGRGDRFALCAEGVEHGCFGQEVRQVAPGQLYAVEVYARGANPSVSVSWQREGSWDWSLPSTAIRFGPAGADGWRRAFGTVRIPAGADALVLLLNMRQEPGERTWFDDASVYRLE